MTGGTGDPTGSGRERNNTVVQLMQCIDQYRLLDGFVLMGATNLLDGLDPALIREGRFDLKVRVDLPDEAGRLKILESQLFSKPYQRFDLARVCAPHPGHERGQVEGARGSGSRVGSRARPQDRSG